MSRLLAILVFVFVLALAEISCGGAVSPADFDPAHEPCRFCRMTGSTGRSSAQLITPNEDPLYFDDIGCLRSHLKQAGAVSSSAVVYVTDHRTGAWLPAHRAIYTYNDRVATPMSSHLIAHESAASRDADPDAQGGRAVPIANVFAGVPVPWSHDK